MRVAIRRDSRSWRVHAIIVAIAIVIGLVVAFFARPTRGDEMRFARRAVSKMVT